LAHSGCICAPARNAAALAAVTTHRISTPANTRAQANIRLSHRRSPGNAGCTVIRTMRLPST